MICVKPYLEGAPEDLSSKLARPKRRAKLGGFGPLEQQAFERAALCRRPRRRTSGRKLAKHQGHS